MRIALFEDEPHNAERLMHLLKKCDMQTEVVAVLSSLSEGFEWLGRNIDIDLILMDIQLSDGNCFELFKHRKISTPIIFTTAYDNFALQAFKVNSIDYLMKPIDLKDLQRALTKFIEVRPASQPVDIMKIADAFMKRNTARFLIRYNSQYVFVKAEDIAYIYITLSVVYAYTHKGQRLPLDYTLAQIKDMLDKAVFFRVNRQFIVNIDAISKISTYPNSRLILKLKPDTEDEVIVSREKVSNFKEWLEGKDVGLE